MAVAAAIKFVQGANVGTPGVALFGTTATSVVVTNGTDTGVATWRWTMVDVPAASSVPVGVVSDGALNSFSFSPDARGGYHVELVVTGFDGSKATRRLVFGIKEQSGRFIPPFDAEATALNFAAGTRGWAKTMDDWLHQIDGRSPLAFTGSGNQPAVTTTDPSTSVAAYSVRATGAAPAFQGFLDGYDGRMLLVFCVNQCTFLHESGSATASNRVTTPLGVSFIAPAGSVVFLVYEGAASRWRLLGGGGAPGGSDTQFEYNNAGAFAGTARMTLVAGEVNHFGTPLHKETKAVFVGTNGYGNAESEWGDARTTSAADTVLFTVNVPTGVGDCHVGITWKVMCSGPTGGGTIVRESTYKRLSGAWTKIGDETVSNGAYLEIGVLVRSAEPDSQNITLIGNGIAATNINWMTSVHAQVVTKAT